MKAYQVVDQNGKPVYMDGNPLAMFKEKENAEHWKGYATEHYLNRFRDQCEVRGYFFVRARVSAISLDEYLGSVDE